MAIDDSPLLQWRPMRSWIFGLAAAWFAFIALLKWLILLRWLPRAPMTVLELPQVLLLASDSPPSRPLAPEEVVILRLALSAAISALTAVLFVIAYLIARKRARMEGAIVSYCSQLENELRVSLSDKPPLP